MTAPPKRVHPAIPFARAAQALQPHPPLRLVCQWRPRIDWACTLRAPVFNIGRVHVTLSELVPEDDDPEPPRAINAALQSEYVRLSGISPAKLTAAMQPYLPSFAPSSSSSSGRPPLPSGSG